MQDAEDSGSVSGLGRSPGGGNGNTLQYSRLENFMDRRAWQATVHGVAKSNATEHIGSLQFSSGQSELMTQAFRVSHWKKSNSKSFRVLLGISVEP